MLRLLLLVFLALFSSTASAQVREHCKEPTPTPFNPASCATPGIRAGNWNLQPLSAITAIGSFNGITMYETEPLPVPSVGAEIDFGDCNGPAELTIQSSGLRTPIGPETDLTVLDGAYAVYTGDGRMELGGGVGFSTSVEITAQDPQTAIMNFVLKDPPAGSGLGDISFEMLYAGPDENDVHPYCDCRAQLRTFLDKRITVYEGMLATYQDTELWFKPAQLSSNIAYDYGTYNQFVNMVRRGLTVEQVRQCFNARLKEVGIAQSDTIAETFKQTGRAAAQTDPVTCEMTFNRDEGDSCYPEIDLANDRRHELIHWAECRNAQETYEGTASFHWLDNGADLADPPEMDREEGWKAYLNPSIQALAETEIRAYQDTLAFYRGWEEANCTPN